MREIARLTLSFCRKYGMKALSHVHIRLSGLIRDRDDLAYWKDILAMTAAASFAVGFIQFNPWALGTGIATALTGIKLDRMRRLK
jgi:hypothetical protein